MVNPLVAECSLSEVTGALTSPRCRLHAIPPATPLNGGTDAWTCLACYEASLTVSLRG